MSSDGVDTLVLANIDEDLARRRAQDLVEGRALSSNASISLEASSRPPVKPQRKHKHRLVTITSVSDGQSSSSLQVPLQVKHTGLGVLSSEEASTPCESFGGLSGLATKMNEVLGQEHNLLNLPDLAGPLQTCIDRQYDFGFAYAYLRPCWDHIPPRLAGYQEIVMTREAADNEMRSKAYDVKKGQVVNSIIPPRRIWDLHANRVVPYWLSASGNTLTYAISHSWMEDKLRQDIRTPINGYQWPVPMPIDTDLERIRIELLNLGIRHAWLDVLCLRQKGDENMEPVRKEEWKIDVPTIGAIYGQTTQIVHYFSGLGRPFRIANLDSERHWLNRAWTLQETSTNSTIAGVSEGSPINPEVDKETGLVIDPMARTFYDTLSSLSAFSQEPESVYGALSAMRHRSATSELDKIAGLSYLLRSRTLPAYVEGQDPEEAWRKLIETMLPRLRGDLLFLFPLPGNGHSSWHPTWQQIKEVAQLPKSSYASGQVVNYDEKDDTFRFRAYRLIIGFVKGLETASSEEARRNGTLILDAKSHVKHEFPIFATHSVPIQERFYTLISGVEHESWIVAPMTGNFQVSKVSVFRMSPDTAEEFKQKIPLFSGFWCTNEAI